MRSGPLSGCWVIELIYSDNLLLNINLPKQVLIVMPLWLRKGSILNAQKGDLTNHP